MVKLTVIIVSYNTRELLLECLSSLSAQPFPFASQLVVVDNGSSDSSAEAVRRHFPHAHLCELGENLGFARANNLGLTIARGQYCLLLNSDAAVLPGSIEALVAFLDEHPTVSAVAPRLVNADLSLQQSYFDFPNAAKVFVNSIAVTPLIRRLFRRLGIRSARAPAFMRDLSAGAPVPVDYVLFACVLIRSAVFADVGPLDEGLFFYHEDCEFGLRMKRFGMSTYYYPQVTVIHHGGASSLGVTERAFVDYYRSLFHVFQSHFGGFHQFALRVAVISAMLFRLCLLPLGAYRRIVIPGTYGAQRESIRRPVQTCFATYAHVLREAVRVGRARDRGAPFGTKAHFQRST